jgi:anionic cell wall polymer biosynthesis LytR-Cps2A-Psr (LCP) family protein
MIKQLLLIAGLVVIIAIFSISFYVFKLVKETNLPAKNYNFLFLGLDPRDDAIEKTMTTDTIIFASFNFATRRLSLTSLPRDLWSYSTASKINQIYPNALKPTPNWHEIKQEFTYITGQKINDVVVITTQNMVELVNLFGGVTVNLKNGFVDKTYPNPAYITNPNPKTPIYITVEFPSGNNLITSSNIIPFIRSRKGSDDPALGGTDLGRIERQQLLIESIFKQFSFSNLNPTSLKKLYHFWRSLETTLDGRTILALGLKFIVSSPISTPVSLYRHTLTDLIYHPEKFITSAWVFIPKAKDYQEIHQFITSSLE